MAAWQVATIRVWKLDTLVTLRTLRGHVEGVTSLVALPRDGIASGSLDATIRIWNRRSGTCTSVLIGHASEVWCLADLTDGRLASGSADGTIRVWDLQSSACLESRCGHTSYVLCLALLRGGCLVSGGSDATVRVWNDRDAHRSITLSSEVVALAALAEGRVALGCIDGSVAALDTSDASDGVIARDPAVRL